MKLTQTLAENWVITVKNDLEEGWEIQLAEFNMSGVGKGSPAEDALENAAAAALAAFASAFPQGIFEIYSHLPEAAQRMRDRFNKATAALGIQQSAINIQENS